MNPSFLLRLLLLLHCVEIIQNLPTKASETRELLCEHFPLFSIYFFLKEKGKYGGGGSVGTFSQRYQPERNFREWLSVLSSIERVVRWKWEIGDLKRLWKDALKTQISPKLRGGKVAIALSFTHVKALKVQLMIWNNHIPLTGTLTSMDRGKKEEKINKLMSDCPPYSLDWKCPRKKKFKSHDYWYLLKGS